VRYRYGVFFFVYDTGTVTVYFFLYGNVTLYFSCTVPLRCVLFVYGTGTVCFRVRLVRCVFSCAIPERCVFAFTVPVLSVSDPYPHWIRIQWPPGSGSIYGMGGIKRTKMKGKTQKKTDTGYRYR
jgi:hypothetical protein